MLKREGQTAEGEGETSPGWEGAKTLHLYHPCAWHIVDTQHVTSACADELEKQDSGKLIRWKILLCILAKRIL